MKDGFWHVYLHVVGRAILSNRHGMCISFMTDDTFHYFCKCGYNNDGVTLGQEQWRLKQDGLGKRDRGWQSRFGKDLDGTLASKI